MAVGVYYYDSLIQPAIDTTYAGTQDLCKHLHGQCKLKDIPVIRDDANNAAVDAYEAKKIFDREFRGKEIDDPSTPGHKMLLIETDEQTRALIQMTNYLRRATSLVKGIELELYKRKAPGPDDEPRATFAPDDKSPEYQIIKAIDKAGFTAIVADAMPMINDAIDRLRTRREASR